MATLPEQKFTSELDMRDPADREEMNKRVFGRNYRKDSAGNPIDESQCSDFSIRNGMTEPHRLESHLKALPLGIVRAGGTAGDAREALEREVARIQKIDHEKKYAAVLRAALDGAA